MKRALCLLFALCLTTTASVPASAAIGVSAASAILIDADDGTVLYEKGADTALAMASTTKIMTALIVLEEAETDTVIRIPREAVGIEGSSAYLYEDEAITVRDLLFALLLQSANDAAVALALHVSESLEAFAARMNEKAESLGMSDTAFANPHGLPAEGHHSTARDMARLMQTALENPEFVAISGAKNYTTQPPEGGTAHYFRNHNRLLNDYTHCIAGKTGYTRAAGRCLVTAAEKGGARLICVTLSAPDDWNDHKTLFEHGFSRYDSYLLYEKGALFYSVKVVGSVDKIVRVENTEPISATLRSADDVQVRYELPHFVYAPVVGLDALPEEAPSPPDAFAAGFAVLTQGEREIARVKLYYTTSAEAYIPPTVWERILQFFGWKKSESKSS